MSSLLKVTPGLGDFCLEQLAGPSTTGLVLQRIISFIYPNTPSGYCSTGNAYPTRNSRVCVPR